MTSSRPAFYLPCGLRIDRAPQFGVSLLYIYKYRYSRDILKILKILQNYLRKHLEVKK